MTFVPSRPRARDWLVMQGQEQAKNRYKLQRAIFTALEKGHSPKGYKTRASLGPQSAARQSLASQTALLNLSPHLDDGQPGSSVTGKTLKYGVEGEKGTVTGEARLDTGPARGARALPPSRGRTAPGRSAAPGGSHESLAPNHQLPLGEAGTPGDAPGATASTAPIPVLAPPQVRLTYPKLPPQPPQSSRG